MRSSLVPLVITIVVIFLKVLCLREQRVVLWSFFLICLVSQMWVLKHIIGEFKKEENPLGVEPPGTINIHFKQWCMFTPFMVFCLAVDVQFAI